MNTKATGACVGEIAHSALSAEVWAEVLLPPAGRWCLGSWAPALCLVVVQCFPICAAQQRCHTLTDDLTATSSEQLRTNGVWSGAFSPASSFPLSSGASNPHVSSSRDTTITSAVSLYFVSQARGFSARWRQPSRTPGNLPPGRSRSKRNCIGGSALQSSPKSRTRAPQRTRRSFTSVQGSQRWW